ncbi:MAG TPA: histidine kinase dimerization/phospho-acceptor domain-containing protein, partial [Candidatus Eisenbacteria bacterium]|nr:histidine kinase dimerization/phospho-acceptor domain-containing protein [Candidatus Eisenbacteria bacterium]
MSLTLSGALSGYLVQQLQYNDAMDQMAKQALLVRPHLQQWDRRCVALRCVQVTPEELASTIDTNRAALNLGESRLILLDRSQPARVVYDSDGNLPVGTPVPLGREALVAREHVREGRPTLEGQTYLAAAASSPTRNVSWIIVAQPQARVAAQATGQLSMPILQSAGAGLLLAIVVTFLLGRAFTRPLNELRRAAEDVAGGNYARRVRNTGRDEIGVVGQAFNRMAEAVERTRHQQRTFLANVSHELKTPLTSLIGFSQALMDGSLRTDEEKARAATILHEEAQRVLRMSQELLDLARVESGQLALNPHPVDLGVQLQQEIEIVRKRAEVRRLVLRLGVAPALPPVHADPDRL